MDFPLSKMELNILQIIEAKFKNCPFASFTKEELIEYQDVLNLLCTKRVLVDAGINNIDAYQLIGSFEGFHKWLKIQQEKTSTIIPFDIDQQANILFAKLLAISDLLATNVAYNEASTENAINDFFRDMIKIEGYFEAYEQCRHGVSATKKDAGSVDIVVRRLNKEVAIVEGMILDCIDKKYISSHIDKAIINYNPLSSPVFLLAYVKASDYTSFWDKCFDYLSTYQFPEDIVVKKGFESHTPDNGAVRIAACSIEHNDVTFPVYFIAIKLLKTSSQT